MRKSLRKASSLVLSIVAISSGIAYLPRARAQDELNAALVESANKLNERAPRMVDEVTRLDKATQLSARLRCAECGGPVHSVKPWRVENVLGKPREAFLFHGFALSSF